MAQIGLEAYIPKQHAAFVKRVLKEKWNHQCAYCGIQERHKELTTDHIIPISKDGSDDYHNLLPSCRRCNISKGDKPIRQWYFDSPDFSVERWNKIKDHMNRKTEDVFAA